MERWTPWRGAAGAVVPLEPVLCLDKIQHPRAFRHGAVRVSVIRCPCSGGRVRVRNWRWPEGGRWSGRDTSCGTVVLQRSLVLSSGPKRQKRTRVGLLCCCFGVPRPNRRCCFGVPRPNRRHIFEFVLVRTLLQLGNFSVAKAIFFRPSGRDNPPSPAKAALQASGGRASIVGFADQFRDGSGWKATIEGHRQRRRPFQRSKQCHCVTPSDQVVRGRSRWPYHTLRFFCYHAWLPSKRWCICRRQHWCHRSGAAEWPRLLCARPLLTPTRPATRPNSSR